MKICFPVLKSEGVESKIFGHFGSAETFLIIDTETGSIISSQIGEAKHEHGACNPMAKFGTHKVDALIIGGIGMGALNKVNRAGIKVFKAAAQTVRENLSLFKEGSLVEFSPEHTCAGHSGGCSH